VDETYIGGQEPGLPGGRAHGKKVLSGIAVEVLEPKGFGRCRMRPLADASAASLHPFVTDFVEPGAKVITDGWPGYCGLDKLGYIHPPAQPAGCPGLRRGPWRATARCASGRIAGQAVAVGYQPGLSGQCALGQLPERVRVPLQPPAFPQSRDGVLPSARTRRRSRASTLQGPRRCPAIPCSTTQATAGEGPPAEPRSSSRKPSVEELRLSGDPNSSLTGVMLVVCCFIGSLSKPCRLIPFHITT